MAILVTTKVKTNDRREFRHSEGAILEERNKGSGGVISKYVATDGSPRGESKPL